MNSHLSHSYVYCGEHPISGEIYFGYRKANKVPADQDIGVLYFTSSKEIKHRFSDFNWTILAEFFIPEDAYDFEQTLIYEHWGNKNLLNKHCSHGKNRWVSARNPKSPESNKKRSATLLGRPSPMLGKNIRNVRGS